MDILNQFISYLLSITFEPLGNIIVQSVILPFFSTGINAIKSFLLGGGITFFSMWAFHTLFNEDFNQQ